MFPLPGLRPARHRRLVSQAELAKQAGLTIATVSRIEHGQPARLSTIRRLAAALQVEPDDLLHEPEPGKEKAAA